MAKPVQGRPWTALPARKGNQGQQRDEVSGHTRSRPAAVSSFNQASSRP